MSAEPAAAPDGLDPESKRELARIVAAVITRRDRAGHGSGQDAARRAHAPGSAACADTSSRILAALVRFSGTEQDSPEPGEGSDPHR